MYLSLDRGREPLELLINDDQLIAHLHGPPELPDAAAVLRGTLETPLGYPALRLALTPDDHVAVVVDADFPALPELLAVTLEHIRSAGVADERLSLIVPPGVRAGWVAAVTREIHDETDQLKVSYLASTDAGRRLYLNRTLVDADQSVVISECRFDPVLGLGGIEGAIFPTLSDEATRKELLTQFETRVPDAEVWPSAQEAREVVWRLGQPFYVSLVASRGGGIASLVAGAGEAGEEARRFLLESWKHTIPRRADVVLASLGGDPTGCTFAHLAQALENAARVVRPGGRLILVTASAPDLGPGADVLRTLDEPQQAIKALAKAELPGSGPARQWARAAHHAKVSLWCGWDDERVEELFATPIHSVAELRRLLVGECVVIEDAHRLVAVVG